MTQPYSPQCLATESAAEPAGSDAATVARQSILDARSAIYGWALFDGSAAVPRTSRDAEMIAHALRLSTGSQAMADRRVLFVRCSAETLASGHLDLVDPRQIVLEVALPPANDAARIEQAAGALAAARRRGFRVALAHDVLATAWRSWLAEADYLMLDLHRLPSAALAGIVQVARSRDGLKLIACNVGDEEQHRAAVRAGLDLFQGNWFSRPVPLKTHTLRPNQAIILELVALLRKEADSADIEALLKRDAALSFNLLHFINAGRFGLAQEITSFRHAVMILGLQRLARWATLLMATSRDGASPAVGQTAVVRGRLMELLATELLAPEQCDHAFVVGVFSLLDTMTGVPMQRALDGLPLPEAVLDALLHRRGTLAPFLELTEACEHANDEVFARTAQKLQLSGHQVNMAHLNALTWAEDLLAA